MSQPAASAPSGEGAALSGEPGAPPDPPDMPADPPDGAADGRGGTVDGADQHDPAYRAAVVDLLGALAYGELTAFSRLAADADLAPSLSAKAELARLAVAEFRHFEVLRDRLDAMSADPDAAMEPFVAALDAFHERTAPQTWLEGLVKAYVGDSIARDFYREISAFLDPGTHLFVTTVLRDEGHAEFVLREVRHAIDVDPRVSGRLALYARRLVGEALSQAQRVAADRDGLTALLVGSVPGAGADLAELVRMFSRVIEAHSRRMGLLGLSP